MSEAKMRPEKAFEDTFRIIFGQCHVKMEELEPYLTRGSYQPPIERRSALSGKPLVVSSGDYSPGAKFIAQDEIDYGKKFAPLDLNEIKDIDSVMSALGDRAQYAGSKVLGHSQFVESSDTCTDSFYVYNSHNVSNSKYVAHSLYVREGSEYVFGCGPLFKARQVIKVRGAENPTRCFESYFIANCSDMFFCFNYHGCADTMFSFNVRSKRHCIGNLELPREQYRALRRKLVEESREYIEKNKSFYSIFDYAPPTKDELARFSVPKFGEMKENMADLDAAFAATTKIILGKPLGPLKEYAPFLSGHVDEVKKAVSPFGNSVYYARYWFGEQVPPGRMIMDEEEGYVARPLPGLEDQAELPLEELVKRLSGIALYALQFRGGTCINTAKTTNMYHSMNTFMLVDGTYSKNCAYDGHMHNCEACFGCGPFLKNCTHCLRCYNSLKLTACMDLDSCTNCSNCLFCHNIENCEECMFCFNVKAKRYAIGNVEYSKEEYLKVKKMVLKEIADKLEKDKKLDLSIYNIGVRGKP